MTSSIAWPRSCLALCSPSTHKTASEMFDLPDPLGPTTTVMPGSSESTARSANDLNPLRTSDLRYTSGPLLLEPVERDLRRRGFGTLLGFAASLADHLVVDEDLRVESAVMGRSVKAGDPVMRLPALVLAGAPAAMTWGFPAPRRGCDRRA